MNPISSSHKHAIAWAGSAFLVLAAASQAVDPRLNAVHPPGVQIGTEVELRLEGNRLGDAQEILFYQTGFEVKKLEEIKAKAIRATIVVAPSSTTWIGMASTSYSPRCRGLTCRRASLEESCAGCATNSGVTPPFCATGRWGPWSTSR